MSDKYKYENGAIHLDHHKELHIGKVYGDARELIRDFFERDAEDIDVFDEITDGLTDIIEEVRETTSKVKEPTLSDSRQDILNQMLELADRGDWAKGITADDVKAMIKQVLGQSETLLLGKESEMSEMLWELLESGRGDRVRVTWQNMVGYLDSKNLLKRKSAPMLNIDFFGDKEGADNINKGRGTYSDMPSRFRNVLPLLDAYVPKVDKKV